MAGSKKKSNTGPAQKDAVHVKYVARAGMWCITTVTKGQQTQKWSYEKP